MAVTIIALLIAIVLPSMQKARHLARTTACASNLRQIGLGVVAYTSDYRGAYPYREAEMLDNNPRRTKLKSNAYDDRPMLNRYFAINELACPLVPRSPTQPIDYEASTSTGVHYSYEMYFGSMIDRSVSSSSMLRINVRTKWRGALIETLVADMEWDYLQIGVLYSAHPDEAGQLWPHTRQDTTHTQAAWVNTSYQRGPIDRNFLYNDLSVAGLSGLIPGDGRLLRVPSANNQASALIYNYVPRGRP